MSKEEKKAAKKMAKQLECQGTRPWMDAWQTMGFLNSGASTRKKRASC
ncbi:hypothetical protein ACFZAT_20545 [Streptomyces sp. NPDC008163]